jgi:hypothetical protein
VARIARILRQPRGNALLAGVGGSGRQSLARVAAFVTKDAAGNRMGVFSIEITKTYRLTEFHEDLKRLYQRAGVEGRPTMFLFSDTQIKEEAFLEDVNNILNTGRRQHHCSAHDRQVPPLLPAAMNSSLHRPMLALAPARAPNVALAAPEIAPVNPPCSALALAI